jgi:hypothetical protein
MGILIKDEIIHVGQVVNLAAAGAANAAVVYAVPVGLVGVHSVKIYRVNLYNLAAGTTQVLIGNGVGGAFAALLPALDSINALNDSYGPFSDLIQVESFANITAYPVALGVGTSINIQLEVIVCG